MLQLCVAVRDHFLLLYLDEIFVFLALIDDWSHVRAPLIRMQPEYMIVGASLVLQNWRSDELLVPLESFRFELHSVINVLLEDVVESLLSHGLAVDV